jgi:hypothetical protein
MLVPIKEFKESEFQCKCPDCGTSSDPYGYRDMDEAFLSRLFTARKMSSRGFSLTSAVRCPLHPLVETRPTSSHNADRLRRKKCKAVDIRAATSRDAFHIMRALFKAGFVRVGWNQEKNFIHVDSDEDKDQEVLFKY